MHPSNRKNISRVLLADDDPVIRHWLTSILTSNGHEVMAVNDGREAFRLLQTDADFKGAVFDMSMPYLDGPDLIRHMRTEKRLKRIPVLLITAESDIQKFSLGLAAGATFSLAKPFTQARLQQILGMMLGTKSLSEAEPLPIRNRVSAADAALQRQTSTKSDRVEICKGSANQPVDLEVLHSLAIDGDGEDSKLVIELIDLYLENARREINTIKAAALENNETSMRKNIHALKGSSLSVGACGIAKVCRQMEQRSEQDSPESLDELVKKLDEELVSTQSVLTFERSKRMWRPAA